MQLAGAVTIPRVGEVSGVVASHTQPVLWIEEDSGNPERVYAIDEDGTTRATVSVKHADNRDWEDIALSGHRLWLADIGDNHAVRDSIQVYWFPEPTLDATSARARSDAPLRRRGRRNAEAMVVDGPARSCLIFSKESGTSIVFRTSVKRLRDGDTAILHRIAQLPLNKVTAGTISALEASSGKAGDGFLWTRGAPITCCDSTPGPNAVLRARRAPP